MEKQTKLSLGTKLGYGVCDLGGNLFFTAIGMWLLNYLTDTVKLLPALAGTAIMIGKIWDAVTDPAVGFLSDHTKSKWGRRRPYILFGSVPLFLTMAFMFTNPALFSTLNPANQNGLFAWAVLAFVLLSTAYTIVNIPYSSLTPELTSDYNEKTSLTAYRMGFAIVGTLIAAGATLPIVNGFSKGGDKSVGWAIIGAIFGGLMLITALITFFSIREPKHDVVVKKTNIFKSYLSAMKSKPFLLILIPFMLNLTAITIASGMIKYYFDYILKKPDAVTIAMMLFIVTAMLMIPVWTAISKKIGKKKCYMTGMSLIAINLLVLFFFGHKLGVTFTYVIMFLSGIGLSTTYIFPWAIIPDTVEYDAVKNGERREGVFYGMWTFMSKIGQALATFLMGWVLTFSNYVANVPQTESAQFGIRLLVGPIPAGIFIIAVIVLHFYPLTKEKYKEVVKD